MSESTWDCGAAGILLSRGFGHGEAGNKSTQPAGFGVFQVMWVIYEAQNGFQEVGRMLHT